MPLFSPEEIEEICNSVSLIDYFRDLDRRGIVRYDRKRGKDEYFLTDNNKFSVTDDQYYDFKAGQGGKIIKAVMEMENKNWREAIEFLRDFSNTYIVNNDIGAEKKQTPQPTSEPTIAEPRNVFTMAITPNNDKLIAYFEGRGIPKDILQTYTQQVHYRNRTSGKSFFGIGLKNQSGGYDVKSLLDKPYDKAKVGRSDMSVIPGSSKEMVVFEGMTDMLSYLRLCRDTNKPNTRTLVVLNSTTNTGVFIDQFRTYEGKIHLVLDGDKAGNDATDKILNSLPNSTDQRHRYNISETGNNDLNDYLINKIKNSLQIQEKSRTLAEENKNQLSENETVTIEPNRVSSLEPVGGKSLDPNYREPLQGSQSQQEGDNPGRQAVGSNHAGNGLSSSERSDLGGRTGGSQVETNSGEQQEVLSGVGGTGENPNVSRTRNTGGSDTGSPQTTAEGQKDEGNIQSTQTGERDSTRQDIPNGNRPRSERDSKTAITGFERVTLINKVAHLSKLAKGNKVSNEQIKDLVDLLTFVDKDNTIQLKEGATITDSIKDIVNHYKSGGITKDGRGVLDEYYTDEKLVNAVRNLIKDNFQGKQDIKVLEPSVGTGNFLHAATDMGINTHITAFEINETTAKIAKILHPDTQINLRSFETEFVTDNGTKKAFTPSYDLVIGNPPYGTHRGLYLGLGEETKLSRYEDYFVKRSLDVMNEGGTLAMVLSSSWLDRQKSLSNGELIDAYRLPNGAFKATGVGTDIVILRKNSQAQAKDITQFFKEHPNKVLGDTIMKKNRFGREEEYIKGNLEDALTRLAEVKPNKAVEVVKPIKPIAQTQEVKQLSIFEELTPEQKRDFVNEFNRKYNNIHIPDYSQFPLFSKINQNFKGKPLQLTEVQKAGIGRLTTKGVGLLAHEVGFGKTLSGILAMHEAMERGNAKRPLIVVPNDNILKQWVDTIYETIPHAKVNVLGNLGKDYDLSHFDNKDGEITLVTYEGFNNIGFNREITQSLSNRFSYINEKDVNGLDNPTQREIEKGIADRNKIEGKMKQGKVYDWEDFGFDHLTFDEVHNANHIVDKVRIEDKRFNSDFRNQNQRPSKLGLNTWVAAQYIQERYDGRNVTLLSATPFTNKPLEYYSILSLVANDRLEKSGYFNVNNFFETFMEADNDMEIDAKGDVRFKTNVRRFKNNALFQQLLSEFIDIKGEEDNPQLKRPNRINKEYKIEQNSLTEQMYDKLNSILDESKDGAILTHILNARKIAISPYLYEGYDGDKPTTKEFVENSPKLKTTMDLIRQNKADKPEAGQIIYSELGVSEFPQLKEYLIKEVGYKDDEVGIITGATSKAQRLDIQEKFNEGKIKVVIGSEAIQEGMNLQENTSDMYLLTLPYNFTSLRQTEGRMWRQGNKWENVRVNYMLTNDSIDVFMLQKLQAKQARYMEAIKKGASVVDVSDVDTQEMKTAIITNPETRARIEVELLKKRLENEKTKHAADLGFISRKYEDYNKALGEYLYVKKSYEEMQKYAQEENGGYWVDRLPDKKVQVDMAQRNLNMVTEKLMKKGINVEDFKIQQESTQAIIEDLDKRIKEELPILENNLIAQYKAEKAERLSRPQTDFVQERAQENKTFYKLIPDKEKEIAKVVAEEKPQESTYKAFKR